MSESTDTNTKTIPWKKILIAAGIVAGLFIMFRVGVAQNTAARERTATTTGVITEIKSERDDDGEKYYYCIVEFEDTDHRKFRATSKRVSGKKASKWKEGKVVKVSYEPKNPRNNNVNVD